MNHILDVSSAIQNPDKIKERNSCSTVVSEDSNEIQDRIQSLELQFENSNFFGNLYFQPEIFQPEITYKLHKRAVHVLLNICWDRDIQRDSLWTALMIFYSFKSKRVIKKADLQKTVSLCILLSCKLLQPQKLVLKDIIQITNGKYSAKQIYETEEEILDALGFNVFIQNHIFEAISTYNLEDIHLEEFCCLTEMLMLKNSDVFWKKQILSSIVKLIQSVPFEGSYEVKADFLELVKSKEGEFIMRKFSSKLDTQKLLQKLGQY